MYRLHARAFTATALLVLFSATGPSSVAKCDVAEENALAEFPVAGDGGSLIVPITIAARSYVFAIDTGATNTVFDVRLQSALGPAIGSATIVNSNGKIRGAIFRRPETRLGPVTLSGSSAIMTADLECLRRGTGEEIFGIVGIDLLRNSIIEVNFDEEKLRILRSLPRNPGSRATLTWSRENLPMVRGQIGTRRFSPIVDTGYPGFSAGGLAHALFDTLSANGAIRATRDQRILTLAGVSNARAGAVNRLSIAGYEHDAVEFDELREDTALGLAYWRRYRVIFDFPGSAMYLTPGIDFNATPRHNRSGLQIVRVSGETLIDAVDSKSAAAASGIQVGDQLVSIDGSDARGVRLHAIRAIFCQTRGVVHLALRRGKLNFKAAIDLGPVGQINGTEGMGR